MCVYVCVCRCVCVYTSIYAGARPRVCVGVCIVDTTILQFCGQLQVFHLKVYYGQSHDVIMLQNSPTALSPSEVV